MTSRDLERSIRDRNALECTMHMAKVANFCSNKTANIDVKKTVVYIHLNGDMQ